MKIDPNAPAFPCSEATPNPDNPNGAVIHYTPGLTKREFFAAMAMVMRAHLDEPKTTAASALEHADAMIAALNAEGGAA